MKSTLLAAFFRGFILIVLQIIFLSFSGASQVGRFEGRGMRKLGDTIKLRGANIYVLDQRKIQRVKTAMVMDSIKMPLANRQDLAAYQNAVDRLLNIIQEDPFQNVANYINLESELILPNTDKLPIISNVPNQYPISQLLLNQLTINVNMIRELLNSPIKEASSLRILDMLIENNKQLSKQTVFSFGQMILLSKATYPKLSVEVIDSNQVTIPSALGYFVTNDVVRRVGYAFCDFTIKPCQSPDFQRIVVNTSQNYLKFIGAKFEVVPFGKYHLFVSDGSAVYYVGSKRVNESIPSVEKITVQLR